MTTEAVSAFSTADSLIPRSSVPLRGVAQVGGKNKTGGATQIFVFMILVMVKAFHPVIIDASKSVDEEEGKIVFLYNTNSTIVSKDVLIAFFSIIFCLVVGGKKQFASIWEPQPFIVFAINGALYTVADILEMASMGGLSGAAYQIMMQSSIILTAFLMMCLKGVYQTRLQWILLFILMAAMSVYMVIAQGGQGQSGAIPIMGLLFAFLKVFFVCLGTVVSDKYAKKYKNDPTHVQIARIYFIRPFLLILASWATGKMDANYFTGWSVATYALVGSYIVKAISALYVVALLDSILKTIAESLAVLAIYIYDVLAPWQGTSFDTSTFLAVIVVVAACASYVDSKATIQKAQDYDKMQSGADRRA